MECKVFYARNREKLQDAVNEWLKTHHVSPESMHFQFSTVVLADDVEFILEHTLVVFYVPLVRVG